MDTAMSDSGWDMERGTKSGKAPADEGAPGQETPDTPRRTRQAPAWVDAQPHRVRNLRQVPFLAGRNVGSRLNHASHSQELTIGFDFSEPETAFLLLAEVPRQPLHASTVPQWSLQG